jgi:hypothetical protein
VTLNDHGGVGYGVMPDSLLITYGEIRFDTRKLLEAAHALHGAVREVVAPIAAANPHYHGHVHGRGVEDDHRGDPG